MKHRLPLTLLAWLIVLGHVPAAPLRPLPDQGPAPLLYVLFNGPPGMRVTFYQGRASSREYATPVKVGLRPGYVYRVKLSGFRNRPGFTLFPTLEVRGTLRTGPEVIRADFPAGVYLSEFDVEGLASGSLLTKVVYLEDPRKAVVEVGRPERPFEVEFPGDRDLLTEARSSGRPVIVLRAGDRDATEAELMQQSVPNTILFPGEKTLGIPPLPPQLPWACFQWYDPILGPKPNEEECLHDGGDAGRRVGFDEAGRLRGLDPEDTVAEYRDSRGAKRITVSNRVCVCVPRFAVLRSELHLERTQVAVMPLGAYSLTGQREFQAEFRPLLHEQIEQPVQASATQRTSVFEAFTATTVVGRIEGLQSFSSSVTTYDITGVCQEVPVTAEKPLYICKSSDRTSAQIGDLVTFTIEYSNRGGRPISDVVISDSLTGRLEYVPGTANSSRNAVFTTQENESGSLIVRWSITGRLLPGDSGKVRFQARVR
jgi:uncharacterized repeat protein (TIGR01451 family)